MSETLIEKYMGRTIEIFPRNSKGLHPVTIDGKSVALYLQKASWVDSLWMARERVNRKITKEYESTILHDYGYEDWTQIQ